MFSLSKLLLSLKLRTSRLLCFFTMSNDAFIFLLFITMAKKGKKKQFALNRGEFFQVTWPGVIRSTYMTRGANVAEVCCYDLLGCCVWRINVF